MVYKNNNTCNNNNINNKKKIYRISLKKMIIYIYIVLYLVSGNKMLTKFNFHIIESEYIHWRTVTNLSYIALNKLSQGTN